MEAAEEREKLRENDLNNAKAVILKITFKYIF